jgi:hypothetical protein
MSFLRSLIHLYSPFTSLLGILSFHYGPSAFRRFAVPFPVAQNLLVCVESGIAVADDYLWSGLATTGHWRARHIKEHAAYRLRAFSIVTRQLVERKKIATSWTKQIYSRYSARHAASSRATLKVSGSKMAAVTSLKRTVAFAAASSQRGNCTCRVAVSIMLSSDVVRG